MKTETPSRKNTVCADLPEGPLPYETNEWKIYMQLKPILFDSYIFYLRNFRQIASLCLPFLLIDASLKLLFTRSQDFQSLYWVSYVAIYPIYTAALILLMAKSANQEHSDNLGLIAASLKLWWPFYLLTVIQLALGLVGFFLFIIPGLLVLARLSFAEFYLILNGLTPWEAIRQSIESTKRYFWYLMGFFAIIIFCDGISDFLIGRAFQTGDNFSLAFIAVSAVVSLLMLFFDVVLFRTFMAAVVDESSAQPEV
ncbi:MAG: hypothetical protein JRF72_13025 [Deltaproteobacteria bacterium]|nr:hypothetical protein [Deltaproteobacteria bacterium]